MKLSKTIAQNIVKEMMNVVPYNINVMNENGIIIGSGDLDRIGYIHEGAVEAIRKKSLNIIYDEKENVKPGVNEPIIVDDKVIGVIGITGYSDEVIKFIKLVKVTTVLLIEQAEANREIQDRRIGKERFYHELAHRKVTYDESFCKRAENYGFDISKDYRAVLVQGKIDSKELIVLCKKHVYNCDLDNDRIVFFVSQDYKYKLLVNDLESCVDIERISIGEKESIAAVSLENAQKAMDIGIKVKPNSKIYKYEDFKFLISLSCENKNDITSLFSNIDKSEYKFELIQTIQTYVEENGQINDVALRLNIHRNTLNYRLDRIRKLTGRDPKNLLQLFELFCGLMWKE